jgi:hypothetical protein
LAFVLNPLLGPESQNMDWFDHAVGSLGLHVDRDKLSAYLACLPNTPALLDKFSTEPRGEQMLGLLIIYRAGENGGIVSAREMQECKEIVEDLKE